jgi:hypothetical protein
MNIVGHHYLLLKHLEILAILFTAILDTINSTLCHNSNFMSCVRFYIPLCSINTWVYNREENVFTVRYELKFILKKYFRSQLYKSIKDISSLIGQIDK